MVLFLGLFSWLLVGLAVGLSASRLLPGEPRLRAGACSAITVFAALAGGLLSSALGFGGLATYDLRALVIALLCSLLAMTWWRIAKLAP